MTKKKRWNHKNRLKNYKIKKMAAQLIKLEKIVAENCLKKWSKIEKYQK